VIGVGPGVKRPELGKVARTDAFYSTTLDDLPVGFDQLSKHLAEGAAGQYVLSYCSPKRKGDHEVEVEIVTEKEHGKLTHKFNADGFVKGCSPKNLPAFVAAKGDKDDNKADDQRDDAAPAPKVTTAAKREKEKEKAKPDDDSGEKAEAPATEAAPADEGGGGAVAASSTTGRAKKPAAKPRKQESKEDKEE
jgi:hypothetical protein